MEYRYPPFIWESESKQIKETNQIYKIKSKVKKNNKIKTHNEYKQTCNSSSPFYRIYLMFQLEFINIILYFFECLSKSLTWDTSFGGCRSQIGCDLQTRSKFLR